ITYAYDSQNRRVSKTVANWNTSTSTFSTSSITGFIYDGWNLIAEVDEMNSNAVLRQYAWGLDASGTLQGAGGVGGLVFALTNVGTYAPAYEGNGNILGWI